MQLFKPGSVSTAGIFSAIPIEENGVRVWRGADVVGQADLRGRVAYGVSVAWPDPGRGMTHDPMEMFALPPLGETVPNAWSAWAT